MKKQFWLMACAPVLLAACEPMPQANTSPEGFLNELPPSLIEMAAPNQDLTAVTNSDVDQSGRAPSTQVYSESRAFHDFSTSLEAQRAAKVGSGGDLLGVPIG